MLGFGNHLCWKKDAQKGLDVQQDTEAPIRSELVIFGFLGTKQAQHEKSCLFPSFLCFFVFGFMLFPCSFPLQMLTTPLSRTVPVTRT